MWFKFLIPAPLHSLGIIIVAISANVHGNIRVQKERSQSIRNHLSSPPGERNVSLPVLSLCPTTLGLFSVGVRHSQWICANLQRVHSGEKLGHSHKVRSTRKRHELDTKRLLVAPAASPQSNGDFLQPALRPELLVPFPQRSSLDAGGVKGRHSVVQCVVQRLSRMSSSLLVAARAL
uniref:Uncharacterized protein n=1 Tax=Pseudictyota dubia TaxID=2749911 RepID=A0A7R9VRI9_9STRA